MSEQETAKIYKSYNPNMTGDQVQRKMFLFPCSVRMPHESRTSCLQRASAFIPLTQEEGQGGSDTHCGRGGS